MQTLDELLSKKVRPAVIAGLLLAQSPFCFITEQSPWTNGVSFPRDMHDDWPRLENIWLKLKRRVFEVEIEKSTWRKRPELEKAPDWNTGTFT